MYNEEELLAQSVASLEKSGSEKSANYSQMKYFLVFYALPIFSAAVFFGIIFFGVIPTIQGMFDTVEEVDQLKVDDENLQKRIDRFIALQNNSVVQRDLINTINEIIPTEQSEVVKFRDRVAKTATQANLKFSNATTGETIIDSTTSNFVAEIEGFSLIQIPSEFDTSGRFIDLRSFLYRLYDNSDFFIVNEMDLNSAATEEDLERWNGGFTLTKYQFYADDNFISDNTFLAVSEFTEPNPAVILFLQETFIGVEE